MQDGVYDATLANHIQTTWSMGVQEFIDHFGAENLKQAREKFETEHELRDDLRDYENVPDWISQWDGPFEVRYQQFDHCDHNGNENCLQGIECPECGQFEDFHVKVETFMSMQDSGSGEHEDVEWDESSEIRCDGCGHCATVAEFSIDRTR
jgi:hypothetical protein